VIGLYLFGRAVAGIAMCIVAVLAAVVVLLFVLFCGAVAGMILACVWLVDLVWPSSP
jgi:hypothetical protein